MPKFFYSMIVVGAGYASRYVAYGAVQPYAYESPDATILL